MTKRLFEAAKHAEIYAKFRPRYIDAVYDVIANFCKAGQSDFQLAVDVGCGSGQSTVPLCRHFKSVIGTDISESQIKHSLKDAANLEFRVGPAEDLTFLSDNSADLVTIAQAIHWVDTAKFYKEVRRVLKPGGSLVVYGYGLCTLDNKVAQSELDEFYNGTIGKYWDEKRRHIENHYRDYTLPFDGWIRNDELKIEVDWKVDEFAGYLTSWSGYQLYMKANPNSDALQELAQRFRTLYTTQRQDEKTEERNMHIVWPIFMLMGQNTK